MTIEKIDIWDFRPPFKDGPYAMSHVTVGQIYGRIFRFQGKDGSTGVGEVVFSPSLLKTEREQRIMDEDSYLKPLIGEPFDRLLDVASEVQTRAKSWRGIAFALDTAWLDREGKRTCQPASQLLGGAIQVEVPDYFSISENEVSDLRKRVDIAGPDCEVFQLKLGVGSLEQDVVQISAFLDMMTDEQIVHADANGGWTVDEACDIIGRFDDERIIWEEPCTTYDDNVSVAKKTKRHIMVDQCVGDPDMAIRAIDEGVAQSICIKPAPLGGLMIARKIRDYAIEAGMRARIDGPWCGDIASAAILHLAIGMPKDLLISGCDLREPVAIPVELNSVRHSKGNKIAPPEGFGHGVVLTNNLFGPPERSICAT
jgi:L-alanine-DL-glutamate epimerase-like enolase superfamily enzyme